MVTINELRQITNLINEQYRMWRTFNGYLCEVKEMSIILDVDQKYLSQLLTAINNRQRVAARNAFTALRDKWRKEYYEPFIKPKEK